MGFKKDIVYLPNFVKLEESNPQFQFKEISICYVGRLSYEKGIESLIEAVKDLDVKLKIIGEGPLKENLKLKVKNEKLNNIDFLGYKSGDVLKNEIKNSIAVILPSRWYENNPRAVLEAFALGKPVIGARIGGIPELVSDGVTGYTFKPDNIEDLREKILDLIEKTDKIVQMGRNVRGFVEENFNPEKHYKELMKIYQIAREKQWKQQ